MAAMGLRPDDAEDDTCTVVDLFYLWPCNERIWRLWHRLQSQWRIGMQGPEGLDYQGVGYYLRQVAKIKPRQFCDVFECLRAMERACLDEWGRQRE